MESCREEVREVKKVQAVSMQRQLKLDEESLQRIKAAEVKKVNQHLSYLSLE